MCDYSLEDHANREARVGDLLTTTALGHHGTVGFTAADDPNVAVCLLPETVVRIVGDVPQSLTHDFAVHTGDQATFLQREVPANHYRDGLRFAHGDGDIVLLQDVRTDLKVEVLTIPAIAEPAPDSETPAQAEAPVRVLEDA